MFGSYRERTAQMLMCLSNVHLRAASGFAGTISQNDFHALINQLIEQNKHHLPKGGTMRFGSTTIVLAKRVQKQYRISWLVQGQLAAAGQASRGDGV